MNILVIGNGFDLAHGLPTKYTHFLKFIEKFREFNEKNRKSELDLLKLKKIVDEKNKPVDYIIIMMLAEFFDNKYDKDILTTEDKYKKDHIEKIIEEMNSILLDNVWIEYFMNIYEERKESDKDGWIDFESEISRVIQSIDNDMRVGNVTEDMIVEKVSDQFIYKYFFEDLKRKEIKRDNDMIRLFSEKGLCRKEYLGFINDYRKEHPVGTLKNEATYKDLIMRLESDLNNLVRALEIYLVDFINNIECAIQLPDIKEIVKKDIVNVVSFNYSETYERIYFDSKVFVPSLHIDYIHGKAYSCNSSESNNMVLGIDEYLPKKRRNIDVKFITFKKYYQRIYKRTGCKYKEWVDIIKKDYEDYQLELDEIKSIRNNRILNREIKSLKEIHLKKHNLYIFGHSLDITDKDILRDLILNDNVQTTIFYYSKKDFRSKISNLVKVIGQDELIKRTGGSTKTIEFKLQQDMVDIEDNTT